MIEDEVNERLEQLAEVLDELGFQSLGMDLPDARAGRRAVLEALRDARRDLWGHAYAHMGSEEERYLYEAADSLLDVFQREIASIWS